MTDSTRHRLADILRSAPDHGSWRVGIDEDGYLALADALLEAGVQLPAEQLDDAEPDIEQSIQLNEQTRLDIARHARWTPTTTTPDAHDRA